MEQEILQNAMMLRQQSEEVEKQLGFVNEQIFELEKFSMNLKEIEDSNEKEILAPLGKGVYAKATRSNEKLFVEVGAGIVVRKTPIEARQIIEKQISKFNVVRIQLTQQLEQFISEFGRMVGEVEKLKKDNVKI